MDATPRSATSSRPARGSHRKTRASPSSDSRSGAGMRRKRSSTLAGLERSAHQTGTVSAASQRRVRQRPECAGECAPGSTTRNARICSTSPTPAGDLRRSAGARPTRPSVRASAVAARLDHRHGGLRRERPPRRAGRQPARPRPVPRRLRSGPATRQLGALHLPRPRGAELLRRLGPRGQGLRGHPALRGRPQPARPGPDGPRRRARHPKRGVPRPLGRPQRPAAHQGRQAVHPPGRGRA